jgi:hypothetical protein
MPTALKSKAELEHAAEKVISFPERIRPDRNLEKWPIWQPAHSKNKNARTFTRVIVGTDGEQRIHQVKVDYSALSGTLTTEDQKIFYALVKIWEEGGRSTEATFFSLQQIARILKKKWGNYAIETITQSLTGLRTIGIIWVDSYFDNSQKATKSNNSTLIPFTILSKLKVVSRKQDGHVTKAAGYFRFDDDILNNLLTNYTKPVLFDVVISLKSEVAQILYTHLDLILADKTLFERRTNELFNDLGIIGKEYYKPSARKRVLQKALHELTGVPVTTGRIASATLEETADGKDYKIVIRKGKLVALPKINHYQEDQPSEPSAAPVTTDGREADTAEQPHPARPGHQELQRQAAELVAYFYEVFHTGKNFQINSKATAQAISLITQYGFEEAKYIVDFAHCEAPKTNYDIQTFGGIIQYSSRALAEYEQRRADQHHTQQSREATEACTLCDSIGMRRVGENTVKRCTHDPATEEAAAQTYAEAERQQQEEQRQEAEADESAGQYLDQLPQEEYQALFAQVQADAVRQYPSLKRMPDDTRQQMIRRLLIRKVKAEQASETIRETHETDSNEPQNVESDQPIG